MFCLVPGPALFEAIVETISAYATSLTRSMAWTTGTVPWPPHVIMFTLFVTSVRSFMLTTGTASGPTAAGVMSIANSSRSS